MTHGCHEVHKLWPCATISPQCAGLLAQQPTLNLFPNGYQAALMDAQAQAQQQQQALGTSAPMQASGVCAYPAAFFSLIL